MLRYHSYIVNINHGFVLVYNPVKVRIYHVLNKNIIGSFFKGCSGFIEINDNKNNLFNLFKKHNHNMYKFIVDNSSVEN